MIRLLAQTPSVLIQGITGKEGQRALEYMKVSGTEIVAGVTPGKGGQNVEGVPVYNTIREAIEAHPGINATSMLVPPKFSLGAAQEAMEAGIKLIHIFAENIPVQDTAKILELAQMHEARIIGPSAVGLIIPGQWKLGSIGGSSDETFLPVQKTGGVAVLSKSGGMANTVADMLTQAGVAQSMVIGIGGDRLLGTAYADLLPDLTADPNTRGVVVIGEIGGSYEETLADEIIKKSFDKPVIAFISGLFAETLPQGVAFGHAGAIVNKSFGTRAGKILELEKAGAHIVNSPNEITDICLKLKLGGN